MPNRRLSDILDEKVRTGQDVSYEYGTIKAEEGTIEHAYLLLWQHLSRLLVDATIEQLKKGIIISVGSIFPTCFCYVITDLDHNRYFSPKLYDFDFTAFTPDERYLIINHVAKLSGIDGISPEPIRTGWEFTYKYEEE